MSGDRHGTPPEYDQWPVEDENPDDVEWVGVQSTGGHVFFKESTSGLFEAEPDEDGGSFVKIPGSEREDGGSLGERIEAIGEEHGWDRLSEFAEEHLEADEE